VPCRFPDLSPAATISPRVSRVIDPSAPANRKAAPINAASAKAFARQIVKT
jgi:hypothetical protein